MDYRKHVIIAGGGAAGMTAAISASRAGAVVTILEKNPRVGKKILATGNGRCNYTNINAGISCYHGGSPEFIRKALSLFTADDAIRFFEELGIEPKVEELGKVFPLSEQASSILDVLLYELNKLGVAVVCDACVKDIAQKNGEFIVTLENGNVYKGDSVILATGGKAMPSSGSDGYGYDLALKLGHSMVDIFPALVQLMLEGPYFKRIEGVKIVGTAEILYNNKTLARERGDILFASYGVSGPPILQISRKAGELLHEGKEAVLKINIMDTMTPGELKKKLERRLLTGAEKPVDFLLVGSVNKRLIPVVLLESGLEDIKKASSGLSSKELDKIAGILTDWRFKIRGTKSWPSAQVTAGGIDTLEIHEVTMESKLIPGLFFAGEIVDVDGQCGGFNLQWAWTSGYLAGKNAAK